MNSPSTHAYYIQRSDVNKDVKSHKLVSSVNQSNIDELYELINTLYIKQNELEDEIVKLKLVIKTNNIELDSDDKNFYIRKSETNGDYDCIKIQWGEVL
jgi:hypothetical protein